MTSASRTTRPHASDSVSLLRDERVLAVRAGGPTDVLLLEPALRALAADGEVIVMCERRAIPAAEMIAAVTDVVPLDALRCGGADRHAVGRVADLVRGLGASRGVVFTSPLESPAPIARVLRLGGLDFIVGRSIADTGSLLDIRLAHETDDHDVERNLELVEAMGLGAPFDRRVRVRPPAARHRLPSRSVVVHPGASTSSCAPSAAVWREVIRRLADDGHPVVLTGSHRDLVALSMRAEPGVAMDLVGQTTFAELGSVLASADALCVGPSMPMHLAAAVGTPVVAVTHTAAPPRRERPWMVDHDVVRDADGNRSPAACAQRVTASVARFVGPRIGAA